MAARKDLRYLSTRKNEYYKYVQKCTGFPMTFSEWLANKK